MAASKARIKPPGQNQAERDRIALGRIESYIDAVAEGHFKCPSCQKEANIKDVSPQAVQLMKMRYDKLRPSLSAVEQTNINPEHQATDTDLVPIIQRVIAGNPDIRASLLALLQAPPSDPAQVSAVH